MISTKLAWTEGNGLGRPPLHSWPRSNSYAPKFIITAESAAEPHSFFPREELHSVAASVIYSGLKLGVQPQGEERGLKRGLQAYAGVFKPN